MDNRRISGPGSGAVKYDILTALTVTGLNGSPGEQISMARLTSLITSRYNWRSDELSMGQSEMARLWGVGERTVKREVKRWLDAGLLICKRAGVRGRVATYRLNLQRICDVSRPIWPLLGSDFAERMEQLSPLGHQVIRLDSVRVSRTAPTGTTGWDAVRQQLSDLFPAQSETWIAPLRVEDDGQTLTLEAKSGFAAEYVKTHFGRDIVDAVAAGFDGPRQIVIRGPDTRYQMR